MSGATPRRILITGVSSALGGRVAQALEAESGVEAIIGIDSDDPRHEFRRTEFVRVGLERRAIQRVLRAAHIDTVIDTRLIGDALRAAPSDLHEVNVVATGELLAACTGPGSPVRQLVVRSSAAVYGVGPGDPAFLTEDMLDPGARGSGRERAGSRPRRTALERSLLAAEQAVARFAQRDSRCRVAVIRAAEVIGDEGPGSLAALLSLPFVPAVLGFDPRLQVIHIDDLVGALAHAVMAQLAGTFNAAGDGVLVLSEAAALLDKTMAPVLLPWGPGLAAAALRRLGARVPVELLAQLRYGRGLDNRRLKAAGYHLRYTTREALIELRARQRRRPLLGAGAEGYRYEPDLEEFLRWSPSVQAVRERESAPRQRPAGFDGLQAAELLELIPSLDVGDLQVLARYEADHQARPAVIAALQRSLSAKSAG